MPRSRWAPLSGIGLHERDLVSACMLRLLTLAVRYASSYSACKQVFGMQAVDNLAVPYASGWALSPARGCDVQDYQERTYPNN